MTLAPVTNSRLQWRTSAVASTSGPTIIPGVSHSVTIGRSNASQSCMNRAALSAPGVSIAPARWVGLLAITPTGRPSMRASAVIIPSPKSRRSSSTEPVSNSRSIDRAHVVAAQPVGRDDVAQQRLVGARPTSSTRPWKYDRYCLATATRLGLVGDDDVDDAVGPLHLDRPDRRRLVHAEPAALDHRRAAHADVRVLGGDDDVAAAEDRGVAGEAVAGVDADERHEARTARRSSRNARQSSPLTPMPSVSPGRPPPPSVKNTIGRRSRSASSNRRSFLRWFCMPCVPASTV